MNIIIINILTTILLFIIILYMLFSTIINTYRLHNHLYYYNESEKACNKNAIEYETVRYNMDLILQNEDNVKGRFYIGMIIVLIVSVFISIISYIYEYIDFIIVYVILFIISILIVVNFNNNLLNDDILKYRKLKREFINALQLYLDNNNITTINDLPPDLLRSLISRYKDFYDFNNEIDEYSPILQNKEEILFKMKTTFEVLNKENKIYIDANELFKYLKLHYDLSNPLYRLDIDYLTTQNLNKNLFEIINEYFWDNEELLKIMGQKYQSIEYKIAKIKPFLKDKYKDSIYILIDDNGNKTSKSVKGKENYYNYMRDIIIYNDVILNTKVEEIFEQKKLYDESSKKDINKILMKNYDNISAKLRDLSPYLKEEYQEAINPDTGEAEVNKGNLYSVVATLIKSNDKLISNNNTNVFYNLSLNKYNPYNSLNKKLINKIILNWIYLIIIFYCIFHILYSSYLSKSKYGIQYICLFILLLFILIMILPFTIS